MDISYTIFCCNGLSAYYVRPRVHVMSCLGVIWYPATSVYFALCFVTLMFCHECMFCTAFHVLYWVHVLHCLLCIIISACFALRFVTPMFCHKYMLCTTFHVLSCVHVLHCVLCSPLSACFALPSCSIISVNFVLSSASLVRRLTMHYPKHLYCTAI